MKKDKENKNQLLEKFSNFVIFQTATGKVNIDVFFKNETLWLPQKSLAELFEVKVPAISKHFGKGYFDEMLERIRDIRLSERRFYQKTTDIYALSADYDTHSELTSVT